MTLVVEASVWVAIFWPDDPRHAVSRAWIERRKTDSVFKTESVFQRSAKL